MKDYFGKEVNIGDTVVFVEPYYHNLIESTIVKFTPKGVTVDYISRRSARNHNIGEGGFILREK